MTYLKHIPQTGPRQGRDAFPADPTVIEIMAGVSTGFVPDQGAVGPATRNAHPTAGLNHSHSRIGSVSSYRSSDRSYSQEAPPGIRRTG